MKRISFFIDEDDFDRLKKVSEDTGAPVAELIRRAIKEFKNKASTTLKKEESNEKR